VAGPIFAVGSLDALSGLLLETPFSSLPRGCDVVVLPTAAAFTGAPEAAMGVVQACEDRDFAIEALMVSDRPSANEPHFATRIREAALVILCDGSPLHARTAWRDSLVGEALASAKLMVAISAVSSVLGDVMIDPRGGAPTTGLGLCAGVAFCAPSSDDQLGRTRRLLDQETALVVLGRRGVLCYENQQWLVVHADDVTVSRGTELTSL
jgi:hypothetical protein